MSYTKLLTVKEVYASIYKASVIDEFFRKGLELDNDRLAISALEELILRGDTDLIVYSLNQAFEKGQIRKESALLSLLARVLSTECRRVDPFLDRYGKALLQGAFMSPSEWAQTNGQKPDETPTQAAKNPNDVIFEDLMLEMSELH